MTMSRVLDELESIESIQVKRVGKVRLLTFLDTPKSIWQQVLPKLRNPISHKVRIQVRDLQRYDLQQSTLPTGITALSTYSMINEPTYPEYAISRDVWKDLKEKEVELIPVEYPGTCLLQIWCYNPAVLEVNGEVDPFSLYLSLQDEDDERVEMALEQLLEKRAW